MSPLLLPWLLSNWSLSPTVPASTLRLLYMYLTASAAHSTKSLSKREGVILTFFTQFSKEGSFLETHNLWTNGRINVSKLPFFKLSEINQLVMFATTLLGFARVEKAKTVFFVVFATKKIGCEHHVFGCEHHVFGCEHHAFWLRTPRNPCKKCKNHPVVVFTLTYGT